VSPSPGVTRVPSTAGVTLAVHDLGPAAAGAPALLAHATGFHGRVWLPLARHLSGLRAWAPDLRGHGDSPVPEGHDFDWERFADDVLAVVDGLGLTGDRPEPPVGIGHSKGGTALLLAEARRPGTFRALWVYEPVISPNGFDPAPDPAGRRGNRLAASARARRDRFDSFAAAEANFGAKPPMERFDPEALHEYVHHGFRDGPGGVSLKCRPADEARVYEMGGHHDAWNRLRSIRCPVTVVRGSLVAAGPAGLTAAVAERLPQGHLETHDDLSHFGPMEAPAAMATSILSAVNGVAGAGPAGGASRGRI